MNSSDNRGELSSATKQGTDAISSETKTTSSAGSKDQPTDDHQQGHSGGHHQSFWLWVMCPTGVDYFSTLGYQPYIAFESAGELAPLATLVLVLLTLFGALPVYAHVAKKSPMGQGSISMLERLMHGWRGKTLVLVLLGFAATDFVITKTLSAADAAVHLIENHYWKEYVSEPNHWHDDTQRMILTIGLLILLCAMFMRGFKEVIGLAVGITAVYLLLNLIILGSGISYLFQHPEAITKWTNEVWSGDPHTWHIEEKHQIGIPGTGILSIIAICLLIFPKLALGLSGFETGIAVMPLIKGDDKDDPHNPKQRIINTRKLLIVAALIMSVMLIGSSFVTATLIPDAALKITQLPDPENPGKSIEVKGAAVERALAFIAHGEGGTDRISPLFGEVFGTIYDISTILILAFAGASAMAGLLNLIPQYLPRYGMAPNWARATKPLVLLFTMINLIVTVIFKAGVKEQSAAYATGVLVLMSSASPATVIDLWRERKGTGFFKLPWGYALITGVFFYTTAANAIERSEGILIASCFIATILISSFASRLMRSKELRFRGFEFADSHSRFLWESLKHLEFPVLVPHRPGGRDLEAKDASIRKRHRLGPEVPIVFIEAELGDTSEFQMKPLMAIREEEGRFVIGVQRCVSIAHVIAIIALECSKAGSAPEIHFGWSNESPLAASASFLIFGEGNVPWMVHELIHKAEPDPKKQPQVFIG